MLNILENVHISADNSGAGAGPIARVVDEKMVSAIGTVNSRFPNVKGGPTCPLRGTATTIVAATTIHKGIS